MAFRSFWILTTIVGLGDLSGAKDQQFQSVLLPAIITHTWGPPAADWETTASLTSSSTLSLTAGGSVNPS